MLNATTSREMECRDQNELLARVSVSLKWAGDHFVDTGNPHRAAILYRDAEECRVAAGYARATHYIGDERDQT